MKLVPIAVLRERHRKLPKKRFRFRGSPRLLTLTPRGHRFAAPDVGTLQKFYAVFATDDEPAPVRTREGNS